MEYNVNVHIVKKMKKKVEWYRSEYVAYYGKLTLRRKPGVFCKYCAKSIEINTYYYPLMCLLGNEPPICVALICIDCIDSVINDKDWQYIGIDNRRKEYLKNKNNEKQQSTGDGQHPGMD